jgi:hypothetical protein
LAAVDVKSNCSWNHVLFSDLVEIKQIISPGCYPPTSR